MTAETPRGDGKPALDLARLLRAVADGRREYALNATDDQAETLRTQAAAFDMAARIAGGDLTSLYGLLPSWRWTAGMEARMRGGGDLTAEDVAALVTGEVSRG